jgi:hypothetical protein
MNICDDGTIGHSTMSAPQSWRKLLRGQAFIECLGISKTI